MTCHGRVDQMPLTYRAIALTMEFCLDCHRDPAPNLRPHQFITDMDWKPAGDARALGEQLVKQNGIRVGQLDLLLRVPPMTGAPHLDIAEIRRRLAGTTGKRFWTSLEEIVDDGGFRAWLEAEFPRRPRSCRCAGGANSSR